MRDVLGYNVGTIHDVGIGRGMSVHVMGRRIAVFRDTYGHFYALDDEIQGLKEPVSTGVLEGDKVRLLDGRRIDLHTGRCEGLEQLVRIFQTWVENPYIFLRCDVTV